jgi:hypothetical protein
MASSQFDVEMQRRIESLVSPRFQLSAFAVPPEIPGTSRRSLLRMKSGSLWRGRWCTMPDSSSCTSSH